MNKMTECDYCRDKRRHPLFGYLLSDRRSDTSQSTYVGISHHPLLRLEEHRRISKTKQIQLEMVIGPFFQTGQASRVKALWRKRNRKLQNRIVGGCELAYAAGLRFIFCRDIVGIRRTLRHSKTTVV